MKIHLLLLLLLLVAAGVKTQDSRPENCPVNEPFNNETCDLDPSEICDYGELCCPGVLSCGNPDVSCRCQNGFFNCIKNIISCPEFCPPAQPSLGEFCEGSESDQFGCDFGELCCGEDCIPASTCRCIFNGWFCSDNLYTDPCPQLCPETKPTFGQTCDVDPRFYCFYDQGVCASRQADESAVQCSCIDSAFECSSLCNDTIVDCPQDPSLVSSPLCDFSDPSTTCSYGELCCPGEEGCGNPLVTCECNNDVDLFLCGYGTVSCPEACPASQPEYYESCDLSDRITCDYGELCCGDDCIPATTCQCGGRNFYCYNNEFTAPCPLLCPETRPSYGDTCDIDPQIRCSYDRGACDSYYSSADSVNCNCRDGFFHCQDFCGDEIFECPDVPAVFYPQCNFTEASEPCDYGQLCCPGDEGCVGSISCICADSVFNCNYYNRISCPQSCPASQPEYYESCDLSDRIDCDYDELCCGEECGPATTCSCFDDNWFCFDNYVLCPEACPEARPAFGDSCSVDPHFICPYDQGTCNGLPDDAHAVECNCDDSGEFFCLNLCSDTAVECPEIPPYISFSCAFADPSEVCEYGEACCPGEEGCGLPRVTCECEIFGYFNCRYNEPFCPVDPTPGICDDDREAKFYSPATDKLEPCVWLASRPEMQGIHCDPSNAASAYYLCEETCGQCTDDCDDDPLAYFEYENKETGVIALRNCHWLSLRNWIQDEVCKDSTSQAGTVCPETCNTCDMA